MPYSLFPHSLHTTHSVSFLQKIRRSSGYVSLACAVFIGSIGTSVWAKPANTTGKKAAVTKTASTPNKKKKTIVAKNSSKAPASRKSTSRKNNNTKQVTAASTQSAKRNKSSKVAKDIASKDGVRNENNKASTAQDLRRQIAALQKQGKKRTLSKAQKQQLMRLNARAQRAEEAQRIEKFEQARVQRLAAVRRAQQHAALETAARQERLSALARSAQLASTTSQTSATTALTSDASPSQTQENLPGSQPTSVTTVVASTSTQENSGSRALNDVDQTEIIEESVPPVEIANASAATTAPKSDSASSPIIRVSIPQRSDLGQVQGLTENHPGAFGPELHSNVAFVMDQNSGQILVNKNGHYVSPIASITKLMTAVITMDANLPMDEMITITDEDVDRLKFSRSRLAVGTTLSRQELLHLALMSSENRAAHALGRSYPGGLSAAVNAMNMRALMLGMRETRYVEPTGLSSENRSSAHDLALLVKAAYRYPLIRNYTTYPGAEFPVQGKMMRFNNTNRLIHSSAWNIGLQKTGYISEAGRCVVMQSNISGRNVIIVLLDSAGTNRRVEDAESLRYWVLQNTTPNPMRDGTGNIARWSTY